MKQKNSHFAFLLVTLFFVQTTKPSNRPPSPFLVNQKICFIQQCTNYPECPSWHIACGMMLLTKAFPSQEEAQKYLNENHTITGLPAGQPIHKPFN